MFAAVDDIGGLAYLVIVVVAVVYQLIRKLIGSNKEDQQKTTLRQQKEETPATEEAKLPYEDLVDEMFGPYIQDRKRKYEARRKPKPEPVLRIIEETPTPVPELKIIEESPAPEDFETEPEESVEAPPRVYGSPSHGRKRTLDEIIFRNPRLSPGARLVLASEILSRPRSLRNS